MKIYIEREDWDNDDVVLDISELTAPNSVRTDAEQRGCESEYTQQQLIELFH